jgi:ribose 5-phosphate isomerase B
MKIALGADSVGKSLLDVIAAHLAKRPDVTVTDLSGPGFYADVAAKVG